MYYLANDISLGQRIPSQIENTSGSNSKEKTEANSVQIAFFSSSQSFPIKKMTKSGDF